MRLTSYSFPVLLLLTLAPWGLTQADPRVELDARVTATLERLYAKQSEAKALGARARGILVFPRVYKGGAGVGAEYGEGALLVQGSTQGYYRLTSLSVGFQLGGQAKSDVVMFMTDESLRGFVESDGWEAGVDGSIAVIEFGVGKEIDTNNLRDPIIGFVFGNKGLMYDLSLEGTKFWKLKKPRNP
ncbi:MAG: lipid-binding SYLF domain-containing protein [Pseudomonadota bacterium]